MNKKANRIAQLKLILPLSFYNPKMFKYILKFRTKKHRKKAGFLSLDFGLKGNKWGQVFPLPLACRCGVQFSSPISNTPKKWNQMTDWSSGKNILYDNRPENLEKLSVDDVQRISLKFRKFNENLKNGEIALVMPKDVTYGLARMWENYTENTATFKTNVFRSMDNALKWIEDIGEG